MKLSKMIAVILLMAILLTAGAYFYQQTKTNNISSPPTPGLTVFLPEREVSALLFDGEKLWVGTSDGILLLDPQSGELLRELDTGIRLIYSAGICQTVDGLVWVGHETGVTVFQNGQVIASISAPRIPGGRINTVVPAPENGIWLGAPEGAARITLVGGELQVAQTLWTGNGLAEDFVNVIHIRPDGELWFGAYLASEKGGLSIHNSDGWRYFSTDDGLPHRFVTAILPVGEEILIGTGHLDRGGLALLIENDGEWTIKKTYHIDDGLPGEKIRQLYRATDGTLWITTESDGLIVCPSPVSLKQPGLPGLRLKRENGLSDNEIKVIVETESFYWLGGRYGLTRVERKAIWDDEQFKSMT